YTDPFGVTDTYWAAGTNNALRARGPMSLTAGYFTLPPPGPFSSSFSSLGPPHDVLFPGSAQPSATQLFLQNAGAFAYTTQLTLTSSVVQVVFVPTNSLLDSNLSVRVFFNPDFLDDGADATVEISYPDFDIVSQQWSTNYLYFIDHTAFST